MARKDGSIRVRLHITIDLEANALDQQRDIKPEDVRKLMPEGAVAAGGIAPAMS
jgi:hypothetical protein